MVQRPGIHGLLLVDPEILMPDVEDAKAVGRDPSLREVSWQSVGLSSREDELCRDNPYWPQRGSPGGITILGNEVVVASFPVSITMVVCCWLFGERHADLSVRFTGPLAAWGAPAPEVLTTNTLPVELRPLAVPMVQPGVAPPRLGAQMVPLGVRPAFPQPGLYRIEALLGGQPAAAIPLLVRLPLGAAG
ncbi:MAG: hypothetical protein HY875_13815 [Chloroflexi bacterium]|nr:hypothetical protein [Chloroflexota bacterium]